MRLSLRRGRVDAVRERVDGLVRLEVDGAPCVAYPRLTGDVEEGDEVLVNVQARELGLGSGGFDVLYANLTRGLGLPPEEGAHVIALPYAPGQWATRFAEEDGPLAEELGGMPVVCCTLHAQLAPVCGAPILAARVSELDERERHRGASHHTRAVYELASRGLTVAWPHGLEAPAWLARREEIDASAWREACEGLPLSFMGRGPDDE